MFKKSVSFDSNITIYEREMEDYYLPYSVHEIEIRRKGECFHACQPKNELIKFKKIVSQCLQHKISVIFGNLGRHIHLLQYFIDLGFEESVAIISDWELNSPYSTVDDKMTEIQILFIIEPSFGKILKPENFNAKNIIVLSSHLNIGKSIFTCFYHVGYLKYYKPRGKTNRMIRFLPPVFYDPSWNKPEGDHICFDLTKCSSASEAFLRLLSGKEMIFPNTFTVDIPQHIQNDLEKQLIKNTSMFTHPRLKYLYFI